MLCVSDLFIMATIGTRSWLKLNDVLWTNFLLVFLERTKLLLPAFPVGSQENRELYVLLLFSKMQNLLNLLQQTWPRGLAAQYSLGGISTNLMSQEMNAFAIKLSGLDLLYEMQYFFFLSSAVYLHSGRCELGWTLVWSFPRKRGGGWVTSPPQCSWCGGWDTLLMRCLGEYGEMFMLLLFPSNAVEISDWNIIVGSGVYKCGGHVSDLFLKWL